MFGDLYHMYTTMPFLSPSPMKSGKCWLYTAGDSPPSKTFFVRSPLGKELDKLKPVDSLGVVLWETHPAG